MSSLGKVRFHICGGEIKPWPEAACQCVGANDFDPVARIAELEALVQMRTEANKHKQARIAELEAVLRDILPWIETSAVRATINHVLQENSEATADGE